MPDTQKNFLGIPIDGDIQRGSHRTAQRPLEEFAPLLQAVLDDPDIEAVSWGQYTPYFNDGDPCEFGTGETSIKPSAESGYVPDDEEGQQQLGLYGTDEDDAMAYKEESPYWIQVPPSSYTESPKRAWLGYEPWTMRGGDEPYVGPRKELFDKCKALASAIGSGAFNDVLLEAFGDHAVIVVRKDKIDVHFYEHD